MGRRRSFCTDRRRWQRGHVWIEAIYVIPVLGIFFSAIPFGYHFFATQYVIQSGTRERTLSAGSRGCGSSGGGHDELDVGGSLEETRRVASQKGDQAAVRATDTALNLVSGSDSRTVSFGPWSRTVTAASFGTCNEPEAATSTEPDVQGWSEHGFEQHEGKR